MTEKSHSAINTLTFIRKGFGFSVEQVAKRLNISPEDMAQYENDPTTVPLSAALELAKAYNISIDVIDFTHS